MKQGKKFTAEQRKVADEATSEMLRIFEAAQTKLQSMGAPLGSGDDTFAECTKCDCEGYMHKPSMGMKCARPGCGHMFNKHDVF